MVSIDSPQRTTLTSCDGARNGIVTVGVGLPLYNWTESTSTCYCFGGLQRPNLNGQDVSLGGAGPVGEWFNTAWLPPCGRPTRTTPISECSRASSRSISGPAD
jgi:hypothetical protein